ncbi:low-density lipoprotein receptor-related protein 1B [Eurytemora carolleeae]|uniref:low-density lipoprotein receptor-related protein 1B n=1 Tax=Eurytemora carolleeae TaxID=1294199 RepID=UPI000C77589E|nr:low-density lipoprotein receptor-related protein 1B [Eurytemora carolleeae]|eukprot:XP_023334149.1 low-density lipoprotein receptor-related protein 1B-like [Eurytemora affinis]
MISLSIIFAVLCGASAVPNITDKCQFTSDCRDFCRYTSDAACYCRFGTCITVLLQFWGKKATPQCKNFSDCDCRKTPKTCFCKNGKCTKEKWECHKNADCKAMKKCSGKECTCKGNLCEYECATAQDCVKGDFYCARSIGEKCGCKEHLCTGIQLPKQCEEISDCVKLGKCTGDAPCACTSNQCVDPYYVEYKWRKDHPTKNCQDVEDCNYSIANCQNDKCTCEKMVKVEENSSWGECTPKQNI